MIHLSYAQELALIERLLTALDVPEDDAASLAAVVTHSDFTGTYSHGLSRLCIYLRQYMAGALIARPDFHCVKDTDASLAFECGGGSGIVAVNRVYDAVLERARKYGIAAGVARNSANIGCGGYYGFRMAKDNMIGIVVSNTYPCMAPFGGADRLIGTNPIILGCPTTNPDRPIVLDISTSGVAIGKVFAYRREDKEMPEGWANDYDGNPTTDPHVAYCVRPAGGHKGYGLAVFVDMFGGVLADALTSAEIPFVEDMEPERTGFAVILLDIAHFLNVERFKEHASAYAEMLKNSRTATGVKEIYLPGEIEARLFEENKIKGLDFSDALVAELEDLASIKYTAEKSKTKHQILSFLKKKQFSNQHIFELFNVLCDSVRSRGFKLSGGGIAPAHADAGNADLFCSRHVVLRVSDEDGLLFGDPAFFYGGGEHLPFGVIPRADIGARDHIEKLSHTGALQQQLRELLRFGSGDADDLPGSPQVLQQLPDPGKRRALIDPDWLVAFAKLHGGKHGLFSGEPEFFHKHIVERGPRETAKILKLRVKTVFVYRVAHGSCNSFDRIIDRPVKVE